MRLRVAFITGGLDLAGAEQQLLYLTRGMDRNRFEPLVINIREHGALAPEFRASGVDLVELGYHGKYDVGIIGRIRRVLVGRGVAIACPYLWPATIWGYAALRLAGISRWIASERNSDDLYDPRWQVDLESRVLRRAPALVAITNAAREFAVRRGVRPERVRVIRIGVAPPVVTRSRDAVRRELGLAPDAPVIACVARFGPQKDHATLVRATRLVRDRVPGVRLVLVGDGPLRPAIEALAAELGMRDAVVLTGIRSDAMELLNACDVAALASSRQEGCSNFLIESALLGKPIASTRVGGIPEAVQDAETGYLAPGGDAEALADALTRLLCDSDLAGRFGAAGKRRAEQEFSLQAMVSGWERLFDELPNVRG